MAELNQFPVWTLREFGVSDAGQRHRWRWATLGIKSKCLLEFPKPTSNYLKVWSTSLWAAAPHTWCWKETEDSGVWGDEEFPPALDVPLEQWAARGEASTSLCIYFPHPGFRHEEIGAGLEAEQSPWSQSPSSSLSGLFLLHSKQNSLSPLCSSLSSMSIAS